MPAPLLDDVLECARSIRPELAALLGAEAESIDAQIAALLAAAKTGQAVDGPLLALLKSKPELRQWAAEFLALKRTSKGYERLPGSSGTVSVQKYVCPEGDYVWYRRSLGTAIPICPTHQVILTADEA